MASTATIHQRFSWPLFASSSQVTLRRSFIGNGSCLGIRATQLNLYLSLSLHHVGDSKQSPWPIAAVGSGLEASITDPEKNDDIKLGNVDIVVESRDDDKICLRVDLAGEETQKVFDDVLTNLARTAPPIPGFRRTKGGEIVYKINVFY
ncbi:hypothetical protein QJS04_geneDACA014189 [Acorus gramineus]|uniref:Trigger factor ribosome-binding bacterial domain-containing protein n=1 Tax=Acorus gramineus TaxID=55184 RepID=A0AAV9B1W8_ACOGR|nr:hypothetical protein QJS04_geneDACA014189 [Acorus gramineus]